MKYLVVTGFVICLLGIGLAAAGTSTSAPAPTPTPVQKNQIVTPDGHILNESCLEEAVIKSGTITVPISNTTDPTEDEINERHNISRNVMMAIYKEFNVPANETVTLGCEFKKGICTYSIVKLDKDCSASALPAFPLPVSTEPMITPTLTATQATVPTAPTQKTPGFEALLAITALLIMLKCWQRG